MAARIDPVWALLIVGWLAVSVPAWLREPDAVEPARPPLTKLEGLPPRELRRLPGVGEVRALAIHAELWRLRATGEALDLESLPGIGPVTAERVRAAIGGARAEPPVVDEAISRP